MAQVMKKIPKSIKESKAAEEINPDVPAVEGMKLVDSVDGKIYYFSVANGSVLLTEVV